MQIVMFTKPFGSLSVEKMGDIVADLGFDGVDLTVRPGGHVLPENVVGDLPRAQEILARRNLSIGMITTGIVDAGDPHSGPIVKTAAKCGIKYLKLGYWSYTEFGQLRQQIAGVRKQIAGIEALAREYGVTACIHNHSGPMLTATGPVVAMLLDGFDKRALGAFYDAGHMTVEGGGTGWKQGLDLLADYVSLVAVKSFGWVQQTDAATGGKRWATKLMPPAEGSAKWTEVFTLLKQIGFDGIVSLDAPYTGSGSWRNLALPEVIEQIRVDLAYLRGVVRAVGYTVGQ